MADDAVYVYCNMTAEGETCVFPDLHSSQMPNIPWRKENDKTDWYSNLRGGFRVIWTIRTFTVPFITNFAFQISYETVGVVQMTFLRLLSEGAYQNFTYTCMNSVAWYSNQEQNHDDAIRFMGDNEIDIGYENSKLRPNVLVDGCKTGKSKSETVFEIRTTKLQYLPIIDFYPVDYGQPQQAFGFQVGPVCFK